MSNQEKYPECRKISAVREKSQAIGEFLKWLQETKGVILCQYSVREEYFFPMYLNTLDLLYEFFEIDKNKAEAEREDMLKELQNAHVAQPGRSV